MLFTLIVLHNDNSLAYVDERLSEEEVEGQAYTWANKTDSEGTHRYKAYISKKEEPVITLQYTSR